MSNAIEDAIDAAKKAVAANRRADLLWGERLKRAIRAGCGDANIHVSCTFPDCRCKQTPKIVKAALAAWENEPTVAE